MAVHQLFIQISVMGMSYSIRATLDGILVIVTLVMSLAVTVVRGVMVRSC